MTRLVIALLMLTALLLVTLPASAANPSGDLRIQTITSYNFVVDSNVESPSTYGPKAATLGAQFCNDGANDLVDVTANIGNYNTATPALSTPGVYPARTHAGLVGTFSLTHEGGSLGARDATRYLGTIPAGQCRTQYWLISYPQLDNTGSTVTGGVKPDDDLFLQYDVWGTATDGAASLTADTTHTVFMRNEISAMANKIWPNGDNKVPEVYRQAIQDLLGWQTQTPTGSSEIFPGDVATVKGIWYDFGNVGQGFDNNGDLVPDQNAWVQPVGDPSNYDPGCFRLVRTYGIVIVKLKTGGEQLIPFVDRLYFENLPENTGVVGLVYYEYVALDGSCTAALTPYQEVASGFDNEKFNADFGYGVPPLVSSAPAVTLDKSASPLTTTTGSVITYQMAIANGGTAGAGNLTFGTTLVVNDTIPAGTTYVAGSATAANTAPSGLSYTVRYSTDGGVTWSLTEPGTPSTVTTLQWRLNGTLPAGESGQVGFQVSVPGSYSIATRGPLVENTATASFGDSAPFTEDTATTLLQGNNSLSGNVFRDDGASGGTLGNAIRDGGEAIIPGVLVTLFFDTNNDGVGDIEVASTTSDASGNYSFGSLIDGNYVVVVDDADSDIPASYGPTTPTTRRAALDPASASVTGVTQTGLNYGFAPALSLDKRLDTPGTIYEGDTVQFTLSVNNTLPGDGSAGGGPCTYIIWSGVTNVDATQIPPGGNATNARWQDTSNILGRPDLRYAYTAMNDNSDLIGLSGFTIGSQAGTITSVGYHLHIRERAEMKATDSLEVRLYYNNVADVEIDSFPGDGSNGGVFGGAAGTTYAATGTFSYVPAGGWTFANIASNLAELQLIGNKGGGAGSSGDIEVDAIALVITTDQTCTADAGTTLSPVPLSDTFDPARLAYVSSDPPADSVGAGTIAWSNVGPLYPGQIKDIVVTFRALAVGAATSTTNTATSSGARFSSGRTANSATDSASVTIEPGGSIAGVVWDEGSAGTTGWVNPTGVEGADTLLSSVGVQLYGCISTTTGLPLYTGVNTSRDCSQNGGAYQLIATTQTDASGAYLFDGLRPGYYYVDLIPTTLPAGSTRTAEATIAANGAGATCGTCDDRWGPSAASLATASLNSTNFNPIDTTGENITSVNFGYNMSASLSGIVWSDYDRSATRDTNETGISGVTVYLCTSSPCASGNATQTTTTSADGRYLFGGLTAGTTYFIGVNSTSAPLGATWGNTVDPEGAPGNSQSAGILAVAGTLLSSYDFGYAQTGTSTIGDTLYYDWDGDGAQDAGVDTGITGVTVRLYRDLDADGALDGTEPLVATDITDSLGQYLFTGLPAGNYLVKVDTADTDFPDAALQQTQDPDEGAACVACDSSSAVSVTGASSNLNQDFGYRPIGSGAIGDTVWKDLNNNGIQSGAQELGIADITVLLEVDLTGSGTFISVPALKEADGDGQTDADGLYLYENLPAGSYRVTVSTSDPDLPRDAVGSSYQLSTAGVFTLTVSSGSTLTADFGFYPVGSIGDTVFLDLNGDGEQDYTEPGVNGVTVSLYTFNDTNNNDQYDPASGDTLGALVTTTTTATDPSTGQAGRYRFINLPPGDYLAIVDTASAPISGMTLSSDPDADGTPCPGAGATFCDSLTDAHLNPGTNFMGADFGYLPSGVVGDTLWIDANGDGAVDPSERGIAFVTIRICTDPTCATVIATTETDINGQYTFANIPDGSYTVVVDPTDPDLPAGLSPSADPDATADGATDVTIAGGDVTSVGGSACVGCRLDADFGYRYVGTRSLGGTICLETGATDGVCDSDTSGVGAGEAAYPGVTVYLYRWVDTGNGIVEAAEVTQIAVTTTDTTGDYVFTGIPDTQTYLVAIGAPQSGLQLTSTAALLGAPTTLVVATTDSAGDSATAYQAVVVSGADVTNRDIAFTPRQSFDYGDLPAPYNTLVSGTPNGPSHSVPTLPSLYLGTAPDQESNGAPSADADGDGADEDGIVPLNYTTWAVGANGGSISATVTGSGWLVGWVDFNNDGDFGDAGETIISRAVTPGTSTILFNIPAGTTLGAGNTFYARFRLFAEQPAFPSLSYVGPSVGGEVEDYLFGSTTVTIGNRVWYDRDGDGDDDAGTEPGIPNVTVTVISLGADGVLGGGDDITYPSTTTDATGTWSVTGVAAGAIQVTVSGLPAGLTQTYDLDGLATANTATATANASRNDYDFGYRGTGSVGDRIFLDLNSNGAYDAGEGIAAVGVTLVGDINGDGTDETFTTTTDSDGLYSFTGLRTSVAGVAYSVAVDTATLPAGLTQTVDPDATVNDASATALTTVATTDLTRDFGYRGPGSIGDRIFLDLDGDGAYDAGEGLTGVSVSLTGDIDGDGVDETFTTTTDADGLYSFSGLRVTAGGVPYAIAVVGASLPTGVTQSQDPDATIDGQSSVTLTSATPSDTAQDFGYIGTGSIGDRVWIDSDGDGVQGIASLEPGLPGAGLTLTWAGPDGAFGGADDLTIAGATDASGSYLFTRLAPGSYRVTVGSATIASTLTPSYDLDGVGTPHTATATLTAGQSLATLDFGYVGAASIGDRVWIDQDSDGVQDPAEPGISGAKIQLTWGGPDGDLTTLADNVLYETATDATGAYLFSGLPVDGASDNYRVTVSATPFAGLTPSYDLDSGTVTPDETAAVVVTSSGANQNRRDLDFGYSGAQALSGAVYRDDNNNGVQDAGEPGIPGVTITLTGVDTGGTPFLNPGTGLPYTTITDASGGYSFLVIPGTYSVAETQPAAYSDGIDTLGSLGGTVGADVLSGVVVAAGQNPSGYNFGEIGGAISGNIFIGFDPSGARQPGDPPIAGVLVTLTGAGPDGIFGTPDDTTASTTTAPDGSYRFPGLPAGSYRVTVDRSTLPPSLAEIFDRDGGSDSRSAVTLGAGQTVNLVDFSYANVTAVTLTHFSAVREGAGIVIRWTTSSEQETWGFQVYRSATGSRADAVPVTTGWVAGEGRGSAGASYAVTDSGAAPGVRYSYWLVEREVSGATLEYGPISAAPVTSGGQYTVSLPIVAR